MVLLCETFFALTVIVAVGTALTTELSIKRAPTATHHSPWKVKLAEWHAKVAVAYNTDPAYLDMMLGAFIANVSVGTPPQDFHVVMDTGSVDFWSVDSECDSTNCKGQPASGYFKNRFDKSNSSTFKNNGTRVSVSYVTGAATGVLVEDTVKFGSIEDTKQLLGLMTQLDDDLGYQPGDGIFGLGFPEFDGWYRWGSPSHWDDVEPPVWKVLKKLDRPLFTVWLDKHRKPSADYEGKITFGALDKGNCGEDWNYVPVVSESWEYRFDNFTVGNRTFGEQNVVIADTGTSWINLPEDVIDAVVAVVGARHDDKKELFVLDDFKKQGLPDLIFNIGGRPYPLSPEDYLLRLASGKCALKIYPKDIIGRWLIGDTFMRRYCHVYDIGQQRIGFAKTLN